MARRSPGLKILGGDDRIRGLTDKVVAGQEVKVGNLKVTCLSTPGHTTHDISFLVTMSGEDGEITSIVFTGDTLFIGNCGGLFEGTAKEMAKSLVETLGGLPDETVS